MVTVKMASLQYYEYSNGPLVGIPEQPWAINAFVKNIQDQVDCIWQITLIPKLYQEQQDITRSPWSGIKAIGRMIQQNGRLDKTVVSDNIGRAFLSFLPWGNEIRNHAPCEQYKHHYTDSILKDENVRSSSTIAGIAVNGKVIGTFQAIKIDSYTMNGGQHSNEARVQLLATSINTYLGDIGKHLIKSNKPFFPVDSLLALLIEDYTTKVAIEMDLKKIESAVARLNHYKKDLSVMDSARVAASAVKLGKIAKEKKEEGVVVQK